MDYSSFTRPGSMTTTDFNTIKSIIEETLTEFQKFIQIQHIDFDLSEHRKTINNQ